MASLIASLPSPVPATIRVYEQGTPATNRYLSHTIQNGDLHVEFSSINDGLPHTYVLETTATGQLPLTATFTQTCGSTSTPVTTVSLTGADSVTTGQNGTYSASANGSDPRTYLWTVTGGTIQSGQGTSTIIVTWGSAGAGSVSVTVGGANGSQITASKSITINPIVQTPFPVTAVTLIGSDTPTANVPETYTASPNGSDPRTYLWTVTGGTIQSGQGTASLVVVWGAAGAGTVGVTVSGYQGSQASASKTVSVQPAVETPVPVTTVTVEGPASALMNQLATYSATADGTNPRTYAWTVTGGTIQAGAGTAAITVLWGTIGTGSVDVTVGGYQSSQVTDSLSVSVTPQTGGETPVSTVTVNGPEIANTTGSHVFSAVDDGTGTRTYQWSATNGTITDGQGTNQVTIHFTANGPQTVTVVVQGAEASSATGTKQLNVCDPITGLSISGPGTAFNGSIFQYGAVLSGTGPFTYSWSVSGGTITEGQGTDTITVNWSQTGSIALNVTGLCSTTPSQTDLAVTVDGDPE